MVLKRTIYILYLIHSSFNLEEYIVTNENIIENGHICFISLLWPDISTYTYICIGTMYEIHAYVRQDGNIILMNKTVYIKTSSLFNNYITC